MANKVISLKDYKAYRAAKELRDYISNSEEDMKNLQFAAFTDAINGVIEEFESKLIDIFCEFAATGFIQKGSEVCFWGRKYVVTDVISQPDKPKDRLVISATTIGEED